MYGRNLRLLAVLAMLMASAFTLSACEEAPSDAERSGAAPETGMSEGAPATGEGEAVPGTEPGPAN